jgi:hypothetical protein
MSDRGTAIKIFESHVPALRADTMSLEEFRVTVTAQIATALNMKVDDCGYLFSKARRASERSGKYNDIDFGAAKRAEPVARVRATETYVPSDTSGGTAHAQVTAVRPGKGRLDLTCFTVLEVLPDNAVGRTVSFNDREVAIGRYRAKAASGSAVWKLIVGLGPNPGEEFRLQDDEKDITPV